MIHSDPAVILNQLAQLQTQILSLQQQNTALQTRNVQLGEELECTKSELRETQALLGQAVLRVNQQPQKQNSSMLSRSQSLRYTPDMAAWPPSRLKRSRSPTLEYVDPPPPPSKRGTQRRWDSKGPEPEQGPIRRPAPPCTSSVGNVKESPRKPIKLEFTPTVEVIIIDDSDAEPDDVSQTTKDVAAMRPLSANLDLYDTDIPRENLVENGGGEDRNYMRDTQGPQRGEVASVSNHSMQVDSDVDDPNVSQDEADGEDRNTGPPNHGPNGSKASRLRLESVRRSPRFSSMGSLTTMSTLTPLPSTPELEDEPNPKVDVKPKREPKFEPKREPKLELSAILSDVTSTYLPDAQPFSITPEPIDLEIPRAFLRLAYGGSDQRFVQYISAVRNPGPSHTVTTNPDGTETHVPIPKDTRRMVFPMLRTSPLMPRTPGAPGLVFTSRQEILHDPPWTLFFKTSTGKEHAAWLYLGEYECELVGKLTPAQFKAQPVTVRRGWARLVVKRRQQKCYADMRARIALRAEGLIPLENKEQEEKLIKKEVKDIQSKKRKGKKRKGRVISIEQVLHAFENGDEAVSVIRMKCVKYDHVFANDIVAQYDHYPTMIAAAEAEKEKKEQMKRNKEGQKYKPANSGRTGSRKQPDTDSEDEDEDEDPQTDEDDDSDSPGEPNNLSTRARGENVTRATPASKSKSRGALSMTLRSRSTSDSGPAQPDSSRPRRPTSAPTVAVIDGSENDDDNSEDGGDIESASEDAFEDDLSDSESIWRSRTTAGHPPSSTPARSRPLRPRKPSQKVLDSTRPAEH